MSKTLLQLFYVCCSTLVLQWTMAQTPINLTTVDVSCDWPPDTSIIVTSGTVTNVTCKTACIPGSSILTFSLKGNNGTDVSFLNSSTSVSCASGGGNRTSTISLDNSSPEQQSENYTLCSVLTDGGCTETRECKSVVFMPKTDFPVSRNGAIVLLVLVAFLLVANIGLIYRECVREAHVCEDQPCGTEACEAHACGVDVNEMRRAALLVYIAVVLFRLKNRNGTSKNQRETELQNK